MSVTDDTVPDGATTEAPHPNGETIRGLRDLADFLERHPELPEVYYTALYGRSSYRHSKEHARAELTAWADALTADGFSPIERIVRGDVRITTDHFAPVSVYAEANAEHLGATPVPTEPVYEPILKGGVSAHGAN